ncbi:MAG: DUF5060 domain-containing protein [Planctomycetota bacterium]|nr:DUF5060 domain-containing protein [Planctomycetota bacterium]
MPDIAALLWSVCEIPLLADADYADVLAGVRVECDFIGPGGQKTTVPAFWDGGRSWKVRFTPTLVGRWTYVTRCDNAADAGLHGRQGAVGVGPAMGSSPIHRHGGFLRVSANRRHLTHTDGAPFFWLGDTWWFCPSPLMPIDHSNRPGIDSMFERLVDLRANQGYSVLHMAFLGPGGVNGTYTAAMQGKIDPVYWQGVDAYIDYANKAGLVPVIGLGFHHGLDKPTLPELQRLWGYFLARYGAHAVTFLFCGEYNLRHHPNDLAPEKLAEAKAVDERRVATMMELAAWVKAQDPFGRAMTIHPWWHGGDKRDAWEKPWHDFILFQGGHSADGPPLKVYHDAYARPSPKPVLEGEANYEGIHGYDDAVIRRTAYRAIQAGSFGYTYGAHGLWYPTQDETDHKFKEWGAIVPWWKAMEFPGGAQMKHLRACYESVDWWKLEPLDAATHLRVDPPDAGGREIVVKADADQTALVYFGPAKGEGPEAGACAAEFHFGDADSRYVARWFDPRSGVSTREPSGPGAAGGRIKLPAPPDARDWMLIVRRAK